ncbi:MAG: PQQ-binding-like beta-propeller repeat protein [Minicystis sp.]
MHRRRHSVLLSATLACSVAGCGARSDLEVGAASVVDPPVIVDPPALVSPWSMRGHDAANRGRGTSAAITDPVELWSFQALSVSSASPAIAADGTLYFHIGDSNKLVAVNPDGTLNWEFAGDPTDGWSQDSSPAVGADGTIYLGSGSHLAAVDPSGHLRWLLPTKGAVMGSPVVAPDGSIDCGDEGGYLYSASPDGVMRWSLRLEKSISVTLEPVVALDGTVYAAIRDTLFAVVEGSVKWTAKFNSGTCCGGRSLSIADDGTILVVGHDGLFAFLPDGSPKWVFALPAQDDEWLRSAASIAADGTAYVSTSVSSPAVARVLAIGADGAFKWSVKTALSARPTRPTVASDGHIYTKDPLQIIDPSGVVTAAAIPVAETSTSIVIGANGTFYTVFDGALHAFGR